MAMMASGTSPYDPHRDDAFLDDDLIDPDDGARPQQALCNQHAYSPS